MMIFPKRKVDPRIQRMMGKGSIYTSKLGRIPYLRRFDVVLDSISFKNKNVLDAGGTVRFLMYCPKSTKKNILIHQDKQELIENSLEAHGKEAEYAKAINMDDTAFYYGDLTKTNKLIPDNTFDIITCMDVLEHIPDTMAAANEIKRMLKPGGYLVATYPTENHWYTIARKIIGFKKPHDHYHTAKQLTKNIGKILKLKKVKKVYPIVDFTHVCFFRKV